MSAKGVSRLRRWYSTRRAYLGIVKMLFAAVDAKALFCHLELFSCIAKGHEGQYGNNGENRRLGQLLQSRNVHSLGVLRARDTVVSAFRQMSQNGDLHPA